MTLEEAIKHEEENARWEYGMVDTYHTDEGVYGREESYHREKAEYHEQVTMWLKELKTQREAWTVVANAIKECSYKIWHEFGEYVGEDCEQIEIINLKTALDILEDYRPKEGNSNADSN